jgi:hypothetical protein
MPDPGLARARVTAHWAAQAVAAAGATLAVSAPDASHTSLVWLEEHGAVAGAQIEPTNCRAALRLPDLHLLVLDATNAIVAETALEQRTLADAIAWLGVEIGRARSRPIVELARPHHDLPEHPAGTGATFALEPLRAREALARWFSDAWRILSLLSAETPGRPPLRIWPHHFDTAFLIALSGAGESSVSIGVGMSPGDASYDEPYWYVTPWPYPQGSQGLRLEGGGAWHEQGWFGAVLRASTLATDDEPTGSTEQFLRSGIAACRRLLGIPL